MKINTTIYTIATLGIISLTPATSFAQQACGGWDFGPCPKGESCIITDARTGEKRAARVIIDEAGYCEPSAPAKQVQPNLPVWFGTEDRVEKTEKSRGWYNSFMAWIKPEKPDIKPKPPTDMYAATQQATRVTWANQYTPPQPTGILPCNTAVGADCAEWTGQPYSCPNPSRPGTYTCSATPCNGGQQKDGGPKTGNAICALPSECSIDANGNYKYGASRDSDDCKAVLKLVDLSKC